MLSQDFFYLIMIYTDLTKKALHLSYNFHRDKKDKGGAPYVYHPYHLAEQMDTEEEVVVALLHDAMEDYSHHDVSLILRDYEIPGNLIDIIKLLTRDKNDTYMEYIAKVKENPIARKVKIVDLMHNQDLSRLPEIGEKELGLLERYNKALDYLLDIDYPTDKHYWKKEGPLYGE